MYCVKCHNTVFGSKRSAIVHKLFTSCIRRCLVSRACDWVMSALSVVLLIFSFQFRSTFLSCRSDRLHSGVLGLANIGYRKLPKIRVGFLYGSYSSEEWFWIDSDGKKGNYKNPVKRSFSSEFRTMCNHCVVRAAWSCKTLKFCK